MSYYAKVGSFNIDTAKTVGQTQAITGVGFQPKVVLFWWSGSTTTGDSVSGGTAGPGIGAMSGASARWCVGGLSEDAQADSDTLSIVNNTAAIRIYTDTATLDGSLDFYSLDSDGFTLEVDDQFTQTYRISFLALGGDDLTNVYVGNSAMPSGTGEFDVTSVGFHPDALIIATHFGWNAAEATNSMWHSVGMATGASAQGTVLARHGDAQATSNSWGYGYNGEVLSAGDVTYTHLTFVEFLSNGFTLNKHAGSSPYMMFYVCLKGGQYAVGDLTTRTDSNDIAETVGFQPSAVLFASANRALSTEHVDTADARISYGAASSVEHRACAAFSDESGLADTEVAYANYDSAVYAHVVDDAIEALMDIKSFDNNGFTCVMDNTETAGCWVTYLAVGPNPTTMLAKVGTLTIDTGLSVGELQEITGVGFRPKVLFFWWSGRTSTGVGGGDYCYGFGAAKDASNQRASGGAADDALATADAASMTQTAGCVYLHDGGSNIDGLMALASMNPDGFALEVSDQFATAMLVSYLALGGDELTDIYIGSKVSPASTGTFDITDPGFQPDAVVFFGHPAINEVQNTPSIASPFVGMATGASAQGVATFASWGGETTDTYGYGYNGECIAGWGTRHEFVQFLSNGFQLDAQTSMARYFFYVALKGGQYSVGDITTRTDGNDIAETVGFQPKAVLFTSANRALSSQGSNTAHARATVGAATSPTERACVAISDEDNLADSETALAHYNDAVYAHVIDDALEAAMDLKSIESDGFACVMDDTETSACWVTYLAIGAEADTAWVAPPADTVPMGATPTLTFTMPASPSGPMHFQLELDKVNTFDGANLRTIRSHASQTGWEYWDGDSWEPVPASGVPVIYAGNNARHTVQTALAGGTWYRRVRSSS